jgi:hypothetical protein
VLLHAALHVPGFKHLSVVAGFLSLHCAFVVQAGVMQFPAQQTVLMPHSLFVVHIFSAGQSFGQFVEFSPVSHFALPQNATLQSFGQFTTSSSNSQMLLPQTGG